MYEYQRMEKAPLDGSVIMVLCGARWPVAAYWFSAGLKSVQDGEWRAAITEKPIVPGPSWWCPLPAQAPTDYLQTLEHLPFVVQGGVWADKFSDTTVKEQVEKMKEESVGPLTTKPIPTPPVAALEAEAKSEAKPAPATRMFKSAEPSKSVSPTTPPTKREAPQKAAPEPAKASATEQAKTSGTVQKKK